MKAIRTKWDDFKIIKALVLPLCLADLQILLQFLFNIDCNLIKKNKTIQNDTYQYSIFDLKL